MRVATPVGFVAMAAMDSTVAMAVRLVGMAAIPATVVPHRQHALGVHVAVATAGGLDALGVAAAVARARPVVRVATGAKVACAQVSAAQAVRAVRADSERPVAAVALVE